MDCGEERNWGTLMAVINKAMSSRMVVSQTMFCRRKETNKFLHLWKLQNSETPTMVIRKAMFCGVAAESELLKICPVSVLMSRGMHSDWCVTQEPPPPTPLVLPHTYISHAKRRTANKFFFKFQKNSNISKTKPHSAGVWVRHWVHCINREIMPTTHGMICDQAFSTKYLPWKTA